MRNDPGNLSIRAPGAAGDFARGEGADDLGVGGDESGAPPTALRVVIAGCPGAGKGTQGARLARRLGVPHLSTGDLLRDAIAVRSSLGCAVERLVRAGRFVPSGLIIAIVESSLDASGYVLDGFPRTVAQAQTLFVRDVLVPDATIELVVPMDVAFTRLIGRGRSDDGPGVARERLTLYEVETRPAVALLDRLAPLERVDGDDPPDVVERRVIQALLRARRSNRAPSPENLRAGTAGRDRSTVGAGKAVGTA